MQTYHHNYDTYDPIIITVGGLFFGFVRIAEEVAYGGEYRQEQGDFYPG